MTVKSLNPIRKAAVLAAFLILGTSVPFESFGSVSSAPSSGVSVKKSNAKKKTQMKEKSSYMNPDFAFPETVEKDASAVLGKALSERNGLDALRAAMQVIVARNMVSKSNFESNVALLDSMASILPQPYAGLSALLEANLYKSLYDGQSWTFNQRTLPLDSYPADPMSWSRDLFAKKCLELIDSANGAEMSAKDMPISTLSSILDNTEQAERVGLTAWDFMVYNEVSLLSGFATQGSGGIIPFFKDKPTSAATEIGKCREKRDGLLTALYDYRVGEGKLYPLAVAVCEKAEIMQEPERLPFLKDWCMKLIDKEEGGMVLNKYYEFLRNADEKGVDGMLALYDAMKKWLAVYSSSAYSECIKNDIAAMSAKNAYLTLPSAVLPGEKISGTMKMENMDEAYILLFKVPESMAPMNGLARKDFPKKATFLHSVKVTASGSIPFSEEKKVELPPLSAGYYVAVPSQTPRLASNWKEEVSEWQLSVVAVSDIAVITSGNRKEEDSSRVYVVDARTQRPISGAEVGVYVNDNSRKLIKKGFTDADGCYDTPKGNYRLRAAYKGNVVWQWIDFHPYKSEERIVAAANILTDLSIYKPGDEVNFVLVGWQRNRHDNSLLKNSEVSVVMRDANYNPVDTLLVKTDGNGRCTGKFIIPKNGLLGTYSLLATFKDFSNNSISRQSFEVAEYKAPGFLVELDSESGLSYNAGDVVKFKGVVKTYSGMPLGDSKISYNIEWTPWWVWWRYGGDSASYGGTLVAGPDGKFEIELPTANLKNTRFEKGVFTLSVSATSASGETQSAPDLRFSIGDGLSVRPNLKERMLVEGDTLKFNVPVYDMLDYPVMKDVEYSVTDMATGKKVASGIFKSPQLILAASSLPSSRYRFEFNLPGDTLKSNEEVAIYRKGDKTPPYKTPLWLPENSIVCKNGQDSIEVEAGSGYSDSWLLCEVSDENGFVSRGWVEANGGNVKVPVKAPASDARIWVKFIGMHDLSPKTGTVVLIPESQTRKLDVKASSFRDKLTAGDKEVWKFSFSIDGVVQKGLPAMAVMSNKALNAIAPFEWRFTADDSYWSNSSYLNYNAPEMRGTNARFSILPRYKYPASPIPTWNTYSYGLAGGNYYGVRIRGLNSASRAAGSNTLMEDGVVEEVLNTVHVTSAPMMMAKQEAVVPMESKSMDMDDREYEMSDEVVLTGSVGAASMEKPRPRPVEMPLAFFMPSLVGGDDGEVEVKFDTPDFNTTWQFQVTGYTDDLLTAGLMLDAVASKPVMVQSNVPRYLRTGDKAEVSALLFNNSDGNLPLHGEIRIFDPMSGSTITSYHLGAETTAPAANRKITVEFDVPSNLSAIGIEAYAMSEKFSDGERTLIPVLPSSTPVVESENFYMGKGSYEFSMKLPKLRKDANVTLKYCDNPVWECVLALPSISTPDSKNILSLMRGLYANSLALDVAEKYPKVKSGLEKALADKENLKSNLDKDSSLKTVALENTPWVNNAASETARMRSLSSLFDVENAKGVISGIMNDVKALQNSDGGWSWCPEMKSSLFMTQQALLHFGMMKHIGCLPADAGKMVSRGLNYCDREVYRDYIDSKKEFSTVTMLNYLYIRSFFDAGNGPSGFAGLKKEALKRIAENWKGFSIYEKATAATLLSRSSGYEREARVILESLNQLASKSETKGWWFDNLGSGFDGWPKLITTAQALEAYSEIEPAAPAVDGLRQWLVLQKETEDWGANPYTVEVIQSILSSGTDWTTSSEAPEIEIGGKKIALPKGEVLTGLVTVSLDPKEASGKKLSVTKKSEGPSWGGVISQYVAPMKDVKAASCDNLKVEKQLMVVADTPSGESVRKASEFKVGDRVRVTLTLTCDKDMNYVALIDERAACMEPDDQISGYEVKDGLWMYREVRDDKTSFFISFLPKGVNVITYDCHIDREGDYAIGITSAQSQYSPLQSAHSSGSMIKSE